MLLPSQIYAKAFLWSDLTCDRAKKIYIYIHIPLILGYYFSHQGGSDALKNNVECREIILSALSLFFS